VDQPAGARPQRTTKGTDNPGGDGKLEAVRIANGDGKVTRPDGLRVAEHDRLEVRRVDADHGQVGVGVVADPLGGVLAAVGEGNLDLNGMVDDMAVGEDKAVGGEDEAGAVAVGLAPPAAHAAAVRLVPHIQVDHGRGDLVHGGDHGGGVGVEQWS